MMSIKNLTRYLLSFVLSLGLLGGFFSPRAIAAPNSFEAILAQVQPATEQLDEDSSISYSQSQLKKIEKAVKDVSSLSRSPRGISTRD